jgi:hypothetical protein
MTRMEWKPMSILSDLINQKITLATAMTEAETWLGQTETTIEKSIAADPAVQSAVTTAITDGKAALSVAESWAGTAMSGELGNLAAEAAALVAKYIPQLIGATAGGPLGAAAVTAIQAIGEVGVAAIQHGVTTALTATNTPSQSVG